MTATAPNTMPAVLDRLRQAARRLGPPPEPPADVTDYDWSRPHHFPAAAQRRLDEFAFRLQRRMSTALVNVLDSGMGVAADPPDECYPAAVDDGQAACYVPLRDANDTPCGALRFPASLAATWVERLLGGTPSTRAGTQTLSPLETGLLLDIASWMAKAVSETAAEAGAGEIHHEPTVTEWAEALPADADTELLRLVFREADADAVATRPSTRAAAADASPADTPDESDDTAEASDAPADDADADTDADAEADTDADTADDTEAEADFADASVSDTDDDASDAGSPWQEEADSPAPILILTSRFLDPVVARDGHAAAPPDPNTFYHDVQARLEATPVTVRADLGTASVPLSGFLALEPGDVLVLNRKCNETIDLTVDGQIVLKARPAVTGGRYAVEIQDLRRHPRLELPV